jgi:hypothetical protein
MQPPLLNPNDINGFLDYIASERAFEYFIISGAILKEGE